MSQDVSELSTDTILDPEPDMSTPLGTLIDELQAKRKEYEVQNRLAKDLYAELEDYRFRIRSVMNVLGLENAAGTDLSVSTKDTEMFQVADPDTLRDFIREHDAFHLLQNRVSAPAAREFMELNGGQVVPGVSVYIKKDLNLRKK